MTMDLHDVLLRMRESRPGLLMTLCLIQCLVLGHDSVFYLKLNSKMTRKSIYLNKPAFVLNMVAAVAKNI